MTVRLCQIISNNSFVIWCTRLASAALKNMWNFNRIKPLTNNLPIWRISPGTTFIATKPYATETKFQTKRYDLHLLDEGPATEGVLTKSEALKYYEELTMIRRMESAVDALYKAKLVKGFCHIYTGQEAIAVGSEAVLRPTDALITTYRCHAWGYYHNNRNLEMIFGELLGMNSGTSRGKGGSMHIYGKNMYGGAAIVGAQVPVGAGLALALKYQNIDGVSLAIYGDGAAQSGQVYEAFNMAALWSLPCIFLCENNLYAMGTSTKRGSKFDLFYKQSPFLPGILVDAMDVLSVREAMRFAIKHCTSGKGPIIFEAKTYRYSGHSMSDPGTTYRTREEVASVRQKRDPIAMFKQLILGANLVEHQELKDIDSKNKRLVEAATAKIIKTGKPLGPEELTYDIYANDVIKEVKNVNPFRPLQHKVTQKPTK